MFSYKCTNTVSNYNYIKQKKNKQKLTTKKFISILRYKLIQLQLYLSIKSPIIVRIT